MHILSYLPRYWKLQKNRKNLAVELFNTIVILSGSMGQFFNVSVGNSEMDSGGTVQAVINFLVKVKQKIILKFG